MALLGVAYRFDSEDTRNSPTLSLARHLLEKGCRTRLHDPYVKPDDQNLERSGLTDYFSRDLAASVADAEILYFCTGHGVYQRGLGEILGLAPRATGVLDGANLYQPSEFAARQIGYAGIGRGRTPPTGEFVDFVAASFRAMETGVANELDVIIAFLNDRYAGDDFNRVRLDEVRRLAATCVTGCAIANTGTVTRAPEYRGFATTLARCAAAAGT